MRAALPNTSQTARPFEIPSRFFRLRYDGARYPGAAGARGLGAGANCQRFAYEILRHFGREIPDFRSCELWNDTRFTRRVRRTRPLDLLLFNRTRRAWGAHVAVYLGSGRAIHLCKAMGRPAVWSLDEFAACDRYGVFLGAKRTTQP
jgi:lipoprotein Spr